MNTQIYFSWKFKLVILLLHTSTPQISAKSSESFLGMEKPAPAGILKVEKCVGFSSKGNMIMVLNQCCSPVNW